SNLASGIGWRSANGALLLLSGTEARHTRIVQSPAEGGLHFHLRLWDPRDYDWPAAGATGSTGGLAACHILDLAGREGAAFLGDVGISGIHSRARRDGCDQRSVNVDVDGHWRVRR